MGKPTQRDHFFTSHDIVARGIETGLHLLFGPNRITDDELRKLIERRPALWGKFAGYLGKRV